MITAGIDIGSLTTKVVIMKDREIKGFSIKRSGSKPLETLRETYREALEKAAFLEKDVEEIVATGYGRYAVPFPCKVYTEITCHAKGSLYFFPKTKTIIDIGGQDSKVIGIDEKNKVSDFAMNDRCAAGTGRFLEVMSEALNMSFDKFGDSFLRSKKKLKISSICTVFAESEVISLITEGERKEDIVKGLCSAIVERVFSLAERIVLKEEFTLSGGVAKNKGVVYALKTKLRKVNIPEEPQITAAVGAALIANFSKS